MCLPLANISICEDKKFTTSVYRKPNFSGVYSDFGSFLSFAYKSRTLYTLTHRCWQICSGWTTLHSELVRLKEIFLKNGCPENVRIAEHIDISPLSKKSF